jgi:glycosyltransferase involved in cell wall biosynthesis
MENTKMKLSIIVPVYNVADYLPKCLDSLLAQDLPQNEYEIIEVNDGSTDDSGVIAQQYADKYPNITLINQANQGLSVARNTGIKQAKGDYIQFVDSDDYLEENVLGGLMKQVVKDNLDVLRFKYQNVRINNESKKYEIFKPYKSDSFLFDNYSSKITDGVSFLNERFGTACYAVMFIIRKTILDNCVFKQGIYFEDTEWTPRMILKSQRIASTDTIVYNYLMREGSITKAINKDKQRKVLEDKIKLIDSLLEHSGVLEDKSWFERMIAGTVLSTIGCIAADFYDERKKYLKELKQRNTYPLSYSNTTKEAKRKLQIINFSPSLYCWLMHIKNHRK